MRESRQTWTAVAAFHVVASAGICTLSSNWVYLAGKGIVLGAGAMDTGEALLPPDSPGQVAAGLGASFVIWLVALTAVIGVCALAADWVYARDAFGFTAALRGAGVLSIWLVVWAGLTFIVNLERGGRLFHPARWPTGEAWDVRDRMVYLAAFFPIVWAVGLPPRVGLDGRPRRMAVMTGAAAISWMAWIGLWRALPWVSIEAYAG